MAVGLPSTEVLGGSGIAPLKDIGLRATVLRSANTDTASTRCEFLKPNLVGLHSVARDEIETDGTTSISAPILPMFGQSCLILVHLVELAFGKARTAALVKKPSQARGDAINHGRVAAVAA